jgi:hypothetical protein
MLVPTMVALSFVTYRDGSIIAASKSFWFARWKLVPLIRGWVGGRWRVVTASFLRASSCRTSPLCLCYFWGFYQAVICVCLLGASSLQAFVTLGCFYFSGGVVILSLFCCRLLYFLFGLSFLELCTLGALLNLWHVKLFPLNKKTCFAQLFSCHSWILATTNANNP